MKTRFIIITSLALTLFFTPLAHAEDKAPWGSAKRSHAQYAPQKVLYDLFTDSKADLKNILDRAALLYRIYGSDPLDSSIVVVIHGDAIPFFSIHDAPDFELVKRANSLSTGTTIEFRMCQEAARVMGYEPKDIHGFVQMVPMADAEIIKLQHNGYAYMQ